MTDEELIKAHIELDPYLPGAEEARVAKYGVPVWALVGHWEVVDGNAREVAIAYELPLEAVEAALRYYERHKAAIDARIAANAA